MKTPLQGFPLHGMLLQPCSDLGGEAVGDREHPCKPHFSREQNHHPGLLLLPFFFFFFAFAASKVELQRER